MDWIVTLQGRGEEFASHVSACSYWLYEHAADAAELLRAWENEQHACASVRRGVAAVQLALIDRLADLGIDTSGARSVLESMKLWTVGRALKPVAHCFVKRLMRSSSVFLTG